MKQQESGFTLIELAIVLLISGTMLGGAVAMIGPYISRNQFSTTNQKMEVISNELAAFAQNYGRLPCPGNPNPSPEPFGSPRNSTADGSKIAKNNCGGTGAENFTGIVPFRALGLTEDDAKDAYGNFFTYAVSPTLAHGDAENPDTDVGDKCKTDAWLNGGTNLNILKAHLCCPKAIAAPPGDVEVLDAKGSTQSMFIANPDKGPTTPTDPWENYSPGHDSDDPNNYDYQGCNGGVSDCKQVKAQCDGGNTSACSGAGTCLSNYNNRKATQWENTAALTTMPNGDGNHTFCSQRKLKNPPTLPTDDTTSDDLIAYVLLSHGKNGDGASRKQNSIPLPVTVAANAEESENRNGDMKFVAGQISMTDDDHYFDDIIMWKTNDQLASQFGNGSCARP